MRLAAVQNRLAESLLFIPAMMVSVSVVVALLLLQVDERIPASALPDFLRLSPEATIQLLSTLAGATVTTAGVVFSLIVVSLQLASSQFSPRVLQTTFRDPLGKLMVGLLASVFVYSVITLHLVPEPTPTSQSWQAPHLTVSVAVLMTVVSVGLLVVYLDRIARKQYVGTIIHNITRETLKHVRALGRTRSPPACPTPDVEAFGEPFVIRADRDGWVQQISRGAILASAPPGSCIRLETRAGAFLAAGVPMATFWPRPARPAVCARAIQAAVVLGPERTMQQDIDFGFRQLTDIALRALSPAVNDPTTAVEVVLRVASIMRPLLLTELPPQSVRNRRGVVLWTPWDLDHADYVRHAFDQLRRHAASHPQVAIALARSLRMLIEVVEDAGRTGAHAELQRELDLTLEGGVQAGLLPEDLEQMRHAATTPQDPLRLYARGSMIDHRPLTH